MADSEDSEIDVCSVDDDTSSSNHAGLTLVAAETYVSTDHEYVDQLVPLTSDDLLTHNKLKTLQVQVKNKRLIIKEKNNNDQTIINNNSSKVSSKRQKPLENGSLMNKLVKLSKGEKSLIATNPCKNRNSNKIVEKLVDGKEDKKENSDDEIDRGVKEPYNRFHFESDHLAIKNNSDYHALLRNLAVLEAQRTQAIKDLERLHDLRDEALSDPLNFVKNLQDKKLEEFPRRQVVASLPEINWVHYMMAYGGDEYVPQITTRKAVKSQEPESNLKTFEPSIEDFPNDFLSNDSLIEPKVDGKPPTHKQKWSIEEQEKLEKLLLLYPPEEVEARRWEKIAKALGTRTPQQVSSRIQKYFLKLAKAKLPIPGRGPTGGALSISKKTKMNPISFKNSSFFPSWKPNVYMNDNEDEKDEIGGTFMGGKINDFHYEDEDPIPEELKETPEYQELMELKKLKNFKKQKNDNKVKQDQHKGFMCDSCKVDPIVGVRWHCLQCPPENSIDFCNNCVQRPFTSVTHKKEHQLTPIHKPKENGIDNDYLGFEQRNKFEYNYLDPNFIPCR